MTKKFDPYYKWLGIPPRDQPPHHYRLLGIELFENDRDVIDAAANRVMAYLKDLATGDEAEYSQNLLNEVSRARICLLNKEKKTAYDKQLQADMKSEGGSEPSTGKPPAKPPAKKRTEASEENTSRQPAPEDRWPKIQVDAAKPKSTDDQVIFAEPDESEDELPANSPRRKLVAAAAVGGLLLAGLIVMLVFLFGSDDQVASGRNGEGHGGQDAPTTDGENTDLEIDPESDPDSDTEIDPETDPSPAAKDEPEPPSDADGGDSSEGDAKPKAKPDDSSDSDVNADPPNWTQGPEDLDDGSSTGKPPTDDNSSNGPPKPEDDPATDSTTDTKDTGPPSDDPPPAKVDMPDVDPPKKEPVVPEPPAKPAQQPFEDLPRVVSLPDLETTTPLVLGPIHCQADNLCFIKLRGGEKASKGAQTFVMRNADSGLAERDWEVLSRDGESGPETKIAHVSINDQSQLAFRWQPEAKTLPLAAHLSNCVFRLSCDGQSHAVALREATRVEGMALELDKPSTDERWKIDAVPDPAAVRIEITGVEGAECTIQPAPLIEANKGEAWIEPKEGNGMLSLKVETEMKKMVEVTVTPHLKMAADGTPQKFNARLFAQGLTQWKAQLAQSPFVIQRWKQAVSQASGQQKALAEQQLALAEQAQLNLQTAVENALKLAEFLENAEGNLQIQFRVYYDADSSEVDLLHIGG